MKRILSSINSDLTSNRTNHNNQNEKGDKINDKLRLRQKNNDDRHKIESDKFSSKLKSIRLSTAKKVI